MKSKKGVTFILSSKKSVNGQFETCAVILQPDLETVERKPRVLYLKLMLHADPLSMYHATSCLFVSLSVELN